MIQMLSSVVPPRINEWNRTNLKRTERKLGKRGVELVLSNKNFLVEVS